MADKLGACDRPPTPPSVRRVTRLTAAVTGTGSAASESSMAPPSVSTGSAATISAANVGRTPSPAANDSRFIEVARWWRWFTACASLVAMLLLRRLSVVASTGR